MPDVGDAVVVTPTIPARDRARHATLAQWRDLGWTPIVIRQDPHIPHGHRAQRDTARTAIRSGLHTGAAIIVYAEDDIDLDPRIPGVLDRAASEEGPCSLWHRPRFRPARIPAPGPDGVAITRARAARQWWGSQCVVLTRAQAARLLGCDYGHGGIDMDLRMLAPIRITVPSLVGHRRLPRAATRAAHYDCDDYTGPRTQETEC